MPEYLSGIKAGIHTILITCIVWRFKWYVDKDMWGTHETSHEGDKQNFKLVSTMLYLKALMPELKPFSRLLHCMFSLISYILGILFVCFGAGSWTKALWVVSMVSACFATELCSNLLVFITNWATVFLRVSSLIIAGLCLFFSRNTSGKFLEFRILFFEGNRILEMSPLTASSPFYSYLTWVVWNSALTLSHNLLRSTF